MVNEFQRTKVQFLTTPPFARKYEPNNFFFDFKHSIVKVHLFKIFVYSEIVFSRTYIYRFNQQTYTNDSSGYAQHDTQHKIYFLSSFKLILTLFQGSKK